MFSATPHRLALVLSIASLTGCQSAKLPTDPGLGQRPYVPLPDSRLESIGFFMAQYAKSLGQWNELKLTASKERELRQLHAVERSLQKRTNERFEELLDVLVQSSPINRQTAALGLGFSGNDRALGPLLAALSDRDAIVVQNALTGLGLLGEPETPTERITYLLINHPDPWTRNNAAFCLQCIVTGRSGGAGMPNDDEIAENCRDALIDEEPGVRVQCASILGILRDKRAVRPLGDLLYDEVNLVSAAAATSLSYIGRFELESKGPAARELVQALEKLEPKRQEKIVRELALMSERNYGDRTEDWREWAYKLP